MGKARNVTLDPHLKITAPAPRYLSDTSMTLGQSNRAWRLPIKLTFDSTINAAPVPSVVIIRISQDCLRRVRVIPAAGGKPENAIERVFIRSNDFVERLRE
jgi:hypothetical protein